MLLTFIVNLDLLIYKKIMPYFTKKKRYKVFLSAVLDCTCNCTNMKSIMGEYIIFVYIIYIDYIHNYT